jgi:hypothetical protein
MYYIKIKQKFKQDTEGKKKPKVQDMGFITVIFFIFIQ